MSQDARQTGHWAAGFPRRRAGEASHAVREGTPDPPGAGGDHHHRAGQAGRDRKYRVRITDDQIRTYHRAARKLKALLLLNLQPGRSGVLPEAEGVREVAHIARCRGCPRSGVGDGCRSGARSCVRSHDRRRTEPNGEVSHRSGAEGHDLPEKVVVYHQVSPAWSARNQAWKITTVSS